MIRSSTKQLHFIKCATRSTFATETKHAFFMSTTFTIAAKSLLANCLFGEVGEELEMEEAIKDAKQNGPYDVAQSFSL